MPPRIVPFSRWISRERVISCTTSEKWRVLSVGSTSDVLVLPISIGRRLDSLSVHRVTLPDDDVVRLLDGVDVPGQELVHLRLAFWGIIYLPCQHRSGR